MKKQIKNVIVNKFFILSIILGLTLVIVHSYSKIIEYNGLIDKLREYEKNGNNPYIQINNAFTMWIGLDSKHKVSKIFYYLFPIISSTSCCWFYCNEYKSGYVNDTIRKIGKNKFYFEKYFSIFIASGLIIAIPLIIDFLIILLFVPAIYPDSIYDIYYGFFSNNFMADVFYMHPFLYVSIFVILNFIYCGLFGCLGHAASIITKNVIVAILTPSVIILLLEHIKNRVIGDNESGNYNFSPFSFLCPAKALNTNYVIILLEIFFLWLITYYIAVFRLRKTKEDNTKKMRCLMNINSYKNVIERIKPDNKCKEKIFYSLKKRKAKSVEANKSKNCSKDDSKIIQNNNAD